MDNTVSIVVPIYKVEKYLHRCVDSVLAQTYTNLEIILVDDGSPDNCGKICDDYASKDSRIKVIHKQNGGLSDARNAGLAQVTGDYIYFLDSDDYIEPTLVERCVITAQETSADVVAFNYIREDELGNIIESYKFAENSFTLTNTEERMNYLCNIGTSYHISGWEAWGRFFSARFILDNNLLYPDNNRIFAEDIGHMLRCGLYLHRLVVIPDVLYHYLVRSDSIMGSAKTVQLNKMVELGKDFSQFLLQRGIDSDTEIKKEQIILKILVTEMSKYKLPWDKTIETVYNELTDENKRQLTEWLRILLTKEKNAVVRHISFGFLIRLWMLYRVLNGKPTTAIKALSFLRDVKLKLVKKVF